MPTFVPSADRAVVVVAAGTTAADALASAGVTDAVVVRDADGALRDLAWAPESAAEVQPVAADTEDGRAVIRHSTAHVLAQAVQELFPHARLGIGPPIDNGFYYDFDVPEPFKPEDLDKIESRMRTIVTEGQAFARRAVSDAAARDELAAEPYKLELIGLKGSAADAGEGASVEVGAGGLTIYDNLHRDGSLAWKDLCRGPHVPTTNAIPAFKLMRSAAAYWRGSEKNPQLQRIYGTAWESRVAQKAHLAMLAEAERRDHRRIGAELDLFSFPPEIGSGLPVFHPKGGIIRRVLEDYARRRHESAGYEFVSTPHLAKEGLFRTSGHLPYYADTMFPPMDLEGSDYYVKAMNCPMHNLIYASRGRSYRELPLRLFEFGSVYRYERSGVVHGLTRVRGMTQDDAHIYCARDGVDVEIATLLEFVLDLLRDYGLDDFYLELSTRGDSAKFIGSDEEWTPATNQLRAVAEASGLVLVPDPGGAAFYGPKISVQARDAIGRSWQMSTIQLDFNQPARFGLEYQAADGSRQQPVMLHRVLFGSIERFFGVLTEHYAGAFPVWLSPVQAVGIPIADDHIGHLRGVVARLRERGLRAEVDDTPERMQKKIRTQTKQKVPYLLIAGDDDVRAGAVSFRFRDGSQRNGVPVDDAVAEIERYAASRSNLSPTAAG
ncbi:MAG: threonine--tRNA ligase [Mycobacteriales bacterium]